ncbi:MAG: lipid-A-disaccharide synthase [Xanthobacteraceae bacterium]|nr:lipid-A-disaccharide synthase [Xanthobacteraceae bacterium]PWB58396.1 MAG: lipid-A-disaccharide synthase [Bradyrhizobiaceae bacterium]
MTGAAADGGTGHPLRVHLVAGEESGDALGAALIRALRQAHSAGLELGGVGGRAMAAQGLASPFAIEELSIIGLAAIPRRLPRILSLIRETADRIVKARPDVLVVIDSPEFTHRVARRVRRAAPEIPIIDYVSPTVWAWRPGRARAMRGYVDHVLAILPFEPAALARLGGPPCSYVGHPVTDRVAALRPGPAEAARRMAEPPVVLILPGSRASEVQRLIGIFGETLARLAGGRPVAAVLPTVPHLLRAVTAATRGWAVQPEIVVAADDKDRAFRTARAALAASGTVTLELALAGIPTVAAYRLPLWEGLLFRMLAHVDTAILANLVLGEKAVPEFHQLACRPERLAEALARAIDPTPERQRQLAAFARLDAVMGLGRIAPAARAAEIVRRIAHGGRAAAQVAATDRES